MPNIYLELELFLDPAITDEAALKTEVEKKISGWNKNINAVPKNKIRVSRAKEYLAQGLSNLQSQADNARKEMVLALRKDSKKARRAGEISEINFKRLKNKYKTFFAENTIEEECHGVVITPGAPILPVSVPSVFTEPKCPDLFVCSKKISYKDMRNITDDLSLIEGGKHKHLYDLMQTSADADIVSLSKKAQEKSVYALKMPKSNPQADPMGRLTGKCINYFKDEQNKKSYDIALKRFPFDTLSDDDFCWNIDKDNGVSWTIYQASINATIQLGFRKEEAEWLVYEYYCKINKCPEPNISKQSDTVYPAKKSPIRKSLTRDEIRQLIQEKKWYTLFQSLEGIDQPDYIAVFEKAKKRVAEFEKNIPTIRQTLQRGNIDIVRRQLVQTKDFIADHPEHTILANEIKLFENYIRNLKTEFKKLAGQGRLIMAENKLRQFLAEHPSKSRTDLVGFARFFAEGVRRFQDLRRICIFAPLGGIIFMIMSISLFYGIYQQSKGSTMGAFMTIGLGFLLSNIIYLPSIRLLYTTTEVRAVRSNGFGYIGTIVIFVLTSVASLFVLVPDIVNMIAQKDEVVLTMVYVVAGWFFSYLLHVYFFSFFQRCEETERPQPMLLPVVGNTLFVLLLSAVGFEWFDVDPTAQAIILHPVAVALLFWIFTAMTAIFDILVDIGFSRLFTDIADYRQRSVLLRQYKDTDFCKPLLQTDWYQGAFSLAWQKQTQQHFQTKNKVSAIPSHNP